MAHAALLGPAFEGDLLAHVLGCDLETLVGTLQRARDQGLISEEEAAGRFRFRHALLREALVAALAAATRRRFHANIVAAFESLPDVDRFVDRLAYHAHEAHVLDKALTYSERAGDGAFAVRAIAEAERYYRLALRSTEGPTSERRLLAKLATAQRLALENEPAAETPLAP